MDCVGARDAILNGVSPRLRCHRTLRLATKAQPRSRDGVREETRLAESPHTQSRHPSPTMRSRHPLSHAIHTPASSRRAARAGDAPPLQRERSTGVRVRAAFTRSVRSACARHDQITGGASPLRALLEGIVSQRQLHESDRPMSDREPFAARTCGMEARGQAQHRMQMKPREAGLSWVSEPSIATPGIQSWQDGTGDGGGAKRSGLTLGDLPGPARAEPPPSPRSGPGTGQKSDHLVVATKPGNSGGAKGVMD